MAKYPLLVAYELKPNKMYKKNIKIEKKYRFSALFTFTFLILGPLSKLSSLNMQIIFITPKTSKVGCKLFALHLRIHKLHFFFYLGETFSSRI